MSYDALENVNTIKLGFLDRLRLRVRLLLSKAAYRLYSLGFERQETIEAIANLQRDLAANSAIRTGYVDHYTESQELATWRKYKGEFLRRSKEGSEVVFRAVAVRDELLKLIENDRRIQNVVNFGCAYGWLEGEVASRCAEVKVWGIDRSESAMSLNRNEFGFANCSFVAGEILEFMKGNSAAVRNGILCHVNIGVYFLPSFLTELYRAACAGGCLYVVVFEPSGVSEQSGEYYRYSFGVEESVVFRGPMLLHNYPNLLERAGYEVIGARLYAPPHAHKDFRSVMFIGRRMAEGKEISK